MRQALRGLQRERLYMRHGHPHTSLVAIPATVSVCFSQRRVSHPHMARSWDAHTYQNDGTMDDVMVRDDYYREY
jgi:hypothetical protein